MAETVGKMDALVKQGASVALRTVPQPCVSRSDDVIVRVMAAGLCRTDVYVADGRIRSADPVILGHEFSGVISDVGRAVQDLSPGDRVTAMPAIPCGACALCRGGDRAHCDSRGFLGIDWQGAFAEYVRVPRSAVHRMPDGLSFRQGAYVEPVAAALGVLRAELPRDGRGLVWGDNRIAQLTLRILRAHGFADVSVHDDLDDPVLDQHAYDFVIETAATTDSMREIVGAVRPLGTIVLKSRLPEPVGMELLAVVRKDLVFRAVEYGSFADAVALLAERRIVVDDLLGATHPLASFERLLDDARYGRESTKVFFAPTGDARPREAGVDPRAMAGLRVVS